MTWLVWGLVAATGVERLVELIVSRRHQERLVSQGARVVEDDGYRAIVAVHVAWFAGLIAEVAWAPWAGTWAATWPLVGVWVLAEGLRLWTIATLGERWTTRVVVVEDAALVRSGPYRWLDHPNYVAVSIQLAALPLAFGAPTTAVAVGAANVWALRRRVRVEETALTSRDQGSRPSG